MDIKQIHYELQNLLSGKSRISQDGVIQTIAYKLRTGKSSGPMAAEKHQNKAKETKNIVQFALDNQLLYSKIREEDFIAEGAEQKVYIKNNKYVLKLNDAIYYAPWQDYFHPELGIILEDLHDENVLTKENLLYFIDTVFYIDSNIFWK